MGRSWRRWIAGIAIVAGAGSGLCAKGDGEMADARADQGAGAERRIVEHVPLPQGLNSVLASLTSVLQTAGEKVDYAYLMGVSSRAFRLQFSWCPSAPHSYIGFNTFEPALKAVGYEATFLPGSFHHEDAKRKVTEEDISGTRETVKASIDAVMPVLFGSEEEGVLIGYEPTSEENPTGWLRRAGPLGPPPEDDAPYALPIKAMPWGVTTLRKAVLPTPRARGILWSLRTAVDNATRGTVADSDLATGFAAWEKWIGELREFDEAVARTRSALEQAGREDDPVFELRLGNAWCYDSLIDARRCAATYLRSIADEFGEDAATHLTAAADAYDEVVARLTEGVEYSTLVAPYPWMEDQPWTDEKRAAQSERLRKALAHEREAVGEIEKALEPMVEAARLLQWQNLYGWSLEACREGAAKNSQVAELNAMEASLEPLSDFAASVRQEMLALEPAELNYWRRVEAIVRAISSGGRVAIRNSAWPWRKRSIECKIAALEHWVAGAHPGDDAGQRIRQAFAAISTALGEPDADKRALVRLTIQRMKDGELPADAAAQFGGSEKRRELLYRIEHLDAPLWSYELNFSLLMRGIGAGEVVAEYNTPDGPCCWVTGDPVDKPKVEAGAEALAASIAGRESDHHFARELAGVPRSGEHIWLVRSLLVHLENHKDNYYDLAEKVSAVELADVERIFDEMFAEWEDGKGTAWAERSDTYMHLACMRTAGWDDVDYADVITLSGYGPSFGYSQEKWRAHYFPPPGRDERIAKATGFGFRWVQYKTPEEYWDALKKSIDAGTPVRGPYMEGVLFIGYRDADRIEDRQVRPLARVFVEPGSWWSWDEFVDWHKNHSDGGWRGSYTGRVETIPPRESAIDVLRMMVQMATDDPRSQNPMFEGVIWGLQGILAYADDLADLPKSGAREEDGGYYQGGWRGCHNVCPQMSGRPAAATYLGRIAPLFEGEMKQHVLAAAEAYGKAADCWHEFDRQLSRALERTGHDHTEAWRDPEHRKAGAAAVREAHDHERDAIAEIQRALDALDGADGGE